MARFVFITGGVVSSLGKGLAAASLGALLQARGYSVRLRKLDPYLNVDPGTMSPFEHGEVFVTDDGAETDLDLGHYERFTGVAARRTDSISSGKIYENVLRKERQGGYLGKTIQVIPHVTNEIKDFIRIGADEVDFMLCEIGGTVGDIEGLPFFEAIRQFANELPRGRCCFMHLTLVPWIAASGELKTKPTQHSVKELRSIGLQPDVLVCRSERPIPVAEREKIAKAFPVSNFEIAANTYKSLKAPARSVSMWNFAVANCELPESFVYEATKVVMSDNARMMNIHKAARSTVPSNWDKNQVLKWHPGAAKWFNENGAKIPASMMYSK